MSEYYFCEKICDERCYTLATLIDMAKLEGLSEIKVSPAKIVTREDYAYCSFYQDAIEVRAGDCGKLCHDYQPRNGKNGRCRHSKNCYEPTDEQIIITIK
jgi:hypothetical protein